MSTRADPLEPTNTVRWNGRSFHWAARFMRAETARDAATLYTFCRRVDDLGDGHPPEVARPALDAVLAGLTGERPPDPDTGRFLVMARRRGIELAAARTLVRAVRDDLDGARIPDADALIRYCHSVAGTVGVMMCPILGVRDPRGVPFAVDLGIAMQLTNIARDVGEDAGRERRYLPATWLGRALPPAEIAAPGGDTDRCVRRALDIMVAYADRYYASAERGVSFIPARARLAILAASHIYAALGPRIRTAPDWRQRAAVPGTRKAMCSLSALAAFAHPRTWNTAHMPTHDATLHAPITGRVGADPAA